MQCYNVFHLCVNNSKKGKAVSFANESVNGIDEIS